MGPQTAALALTLSPPQDSQQPCPGGYSIWREMGEGCSPVLGVATGQSEDPSTGKWGLGGSRKPRIWPKQERCNSSGLVIKAQDPDLPAPALVGRPPGAVESGACLGGTDGCGRSRAFFSGIEVKSQRLRGCEGEGNSFLPCSPVPAGPSLSTHPPAPLPVPSSARPLAAAAG